MVRWTTLASRELVALVDYVKERSPPSALKISHRIQAIEAALVESPMLGQKTDELDWLRRIAVSPYPYLIFYEVTASDIVIHRIRHAARRPIRT